MNIDRLIGGEMEQEKEYYPNYLCACGCGQKIMIKESHKSNGIPIYIHGHNGRGKPLSEEHCRKMSELNKGEKNPNFGKPLSEEHRKKLRESNLGRPRSKELRKKLSEIGKKRIISEETRRKRSETIIRNGALKGKNHPLFGKHHSENTCKKISNAIKGDKHGNWKGGTSLDPYCPVFRRSVFKRMIFKRDHNSCQLCGMTNQLSFKINGRRLTIHHIDHDKMNCDSRNCILACMRCNTIVENKDLRIFYENWFNSMFEKVTDGD